MLKGDNGLDTGYCQGVESCGEVTRMITSPLPPTDGSTDAQGRSSSHATDNKPTLQGTHSHLQSHEKHSFKLIYNDGGGGGETTTNNCHFLFTPFPVPELWSLCFSLNRNISHDALQLHVDHLFCRKYHYHQFGRPYFNVADLGP